MKRNNQRLQGVLFYPQQQEIGEATLILRPQGENSKLKVVFNSSTSDEGTYQANALQRQGNQLVGQWTSLEGNAQGQIKAQIQTIDGGCLINGVVIDQQNHQRNFNMQLVSEEEQAQQQQYSQQQQQQPVSSHSQSSTNI